MAGGIKIRTRMKDLQCGEKIIKICNWQLRKLSSVRNEKETELRSFAAIQEYVTKFYSDLYSYKLGDEVKINIYFFKYYVVNMTM